MGNGSYNFTVVDRSAEKSNVGITIGTVTAITLPGYLTSTGAFKTATEAIMLGTVAKDELKAFSNQLSTTVPSSPWANRETKFLVRYRDNTEYFDAPTNSIQNEGFGRIHNLEIPCAKLDLTGLLLPNSDFVNLAQTQIAAWITAFEAVALSPSNGAVKVVSIEIVGRNI